MMSSKMHQYSTLCQIHYSLIWIPEKFYVMSVQLASQLASCKKYSNDVNIKKRISKMLWFSFVQVLDQSLAWTDVRTWLQWSGPWLTQDVSSINQIISTEGLNQKYSWAQTRSRMIEWLKLVDCHDRRQITILQGRCTLFFSLMPSPRIAYKI